MPCLNISLEICDFVFMYEICRPNKYWYFYSKQLSNVAVGDGRLGYPEDAPYNAIHVGAAAPTLPQDVSCIQTSVIFL